MTAFERLSKITTQPGTAEVTILSTTEWPNFGDRLGFHLIPRIVPPGITVNNIFSPQLQSWVPSARRPRVVILFLGSSIFQAMLTRDLLNFIRSFEIRIG